MAVLCIIVVVKTAISRETCKWQRHYGNIALSHTALT